MEGVKKRKNYPRTCRDSVAPVLMKKRSAARNRVRRSVRVVTAAAAAAATAAAVSILSSRTEVAQAFLCGPATTTTTRRFRIPSHNNKQSLTSSTLHSRSSGGSSISNSSGSGSERRNGNYHRNFDRGSSSIYSGRNGWRQQRGPSAAAGPATPLGKTGGGGIRRPRSMTPFHAEPAGGSGKDAAIPAAQSSGVRDTGLAGGNKQNHGHQQQQQQQPPQQQRKQGGGGGGGRPFGHITDETLDLIRASTSITEVISQ